MDFQETSNPNNISDEGNNGFQRTLFNSAITNESLSPGTSSPLRLTHSSASHPLAEGVAADAPSHSSSTMITSDSEIRLPSQARVDTAISSEEDGGSMRQFRPRKSDDENVRVAAIITSFAGAWLALNGYRCRECLELLHSLPRNHFSSGWVQNVLGKAYFEMCEYKPALLALKEMMRLEPFRIKGVDILSTTLWHLRKEKELCSLAQQVVEVDKFSPETWCVVGNCFSLQRETETAIKFFERALQIDPTFTYAHTLCGHEMVSNEDLDKATKAFRNALRFDDRHYNALYGLGAIYYRQEKYDMAESHFRSAIRINPTSSGSATPLVISMCQISHTTHSHHVLS